MINVLTEAEKRRYSKQISLETIGIEGQEKIKNSKILVVGAGGLGGVVLQYLTSAGVGTIGIADDFPIEEVHLPRQVLYSDNNIGKLKTIVAKEKLNEQNSNTEINIYNIFLKNKTAKDIISNYDIIVECTDSIETKYLINDISITCNKPLVLASIYKNEGQISVYNYKEGPSFRCIFPEKEDRQIHIPSQSGIFSPLVGLIGSIQAAEVLKIILENDKVLSGKLLNYNLLTHQSYIINFKKNPLNFIQ
jgi:adenylyltransferase/sulfurtransferase